MALNQHSSNLIDLTVKAFNGDVTSVSLTDGISLIDSWISFLQADEQQNGEVIGGLRDLKAELQGSLDSTSIQRILKTLSEQTTLAAESVDTDDKSTLNALSGALQSFSKQVNGESGPAKTGGQAPMTSTVGGESTNSGVGASALGSDGDDLSDRTGGITDSDPAIDMDDTMGSDGGTSKDRPSSDSDGTGDSSYSSQPGHSRSDTSRVDGIGISGGTGDTATTQSGGRSQY